MTPGWRLSYRPALDGVRGVAIVLVLLGHAAIPGFASAQNVGVTLFFVLSGFLITGLLVTEHDEHGRVSLRRFYLRRALRLLPALITVLMVVAVALVALGQADDVPGIILPPLFYVANWALVLDHDLGVLRHTWSLSIEEQFYIVWPLVLLGLLWLQRWHAALVIAVLGVVTVTIVRFGQETATGLSLHGLWGTDARADAILLGCALALIAHRGVRLLYPRVMLMLGFGLLLVLGAGFTILDGVWDFTFAALAGAVVVLASEGHPARWLTWRPLVWIGTISYGLYLWHQVIFRAGRALVPDAPLWIEAPVLTAIAVGVAFLSWRYVETPFLRLKGRLSDQPVLDRSGEDERPARAVLGGGGVDVLVGGPGEHRVDGRGRIDPRRSTV